MTCLIVNHLAQAVKVIIGAGRCGVLQGGVGEGGAKVVRRVGVLIVGVDSIGSLWMNLYSFVCWGTL